MNIILYDTPERINFFPLTLTRPVAELKVGYFTLREKWMRILKCEVSYLTEDYLSKKFPTTHRPKSIYIDARLIPNKETASVIATLGNNQAISFNNRIIAFSADEIKYQDIENISISQFDDVLELTTLQIIEKNHHLISLLKDELYHDIKLLYKTRKLINPDDTNLLINSDDIFMEKGAKIQGCTINASSGPVYIMKNAEIMEGALIRGPIILGPHSIIKMGTKVYGPVSIGEHCRVGGEVTDVVFHAYSNKGHDGFLGHSYIGEWCNLGADTNNSNLKNGYQKVKIWNYASQRFEQTGMQFMGLIMGDHSKSAINTMFNTGTVIGVAANIYGSGFPRNFVPSFSEGGFHGLKTAGLKPILKTAETMMSRRNINLSEDEKEILSKVFEITAAFRK